MLPRAEQSDFGQNRGEELEQTLGKMDHLLTQEEAAGVNRPVEGDDDSVAQLGGIVAERGTELT